MAGIKTNYGSKRDFDIKLGNPPFFGNSSRQAQRLQINASSETDVEPDTPALETCQISRLITERY